MRRSQKASAIKERLVTLNDTAYYKLHIPKPPNPIKRWETYLFKKDALHGGLQPPSFASKNISCLGKMLVFLVCGCLWFILIYVACRKVWFALISYHICMPCLHFKHKIFDLSLFLLSKTTFEMHKGMLKLAKEFRSSKLKGLNAQLPTDGQITLSCREKYIKKPKFLHTLSPSLYPLRVVSALPWTLSLYHCCCAAHCIPI